MKLLRTLKMKIEAASSMHQASYPAMPCKEHGTTSYGIGKVYLNTKHQHFRVIFDKKKPSKEKMLKSELRAMPGRIDSWITTYNSLTTT